MRSRVSSLTSGLPRSARETVACETPARWAMSMDVALCLLTLDRYPRYGRLTGRPTSLHASGLPAGMRSGGRRRQRAASTPLHREPGAQRGARRQPGRAADVEGIGRPAFRFDAGGMRRLVIHHPVAAVRGELQALARVVHDHRIVVEEAVVPWAC